jgi:hypothetical protein
MARPDQVELSIELISGSATSRVTVCYRAIFTQAEVAGNLRSREVIQLFGEDPPAGPAGDDLLFTFFPTHVVRPNGQRIRRFCRTIMVPNSVLDEDLGADQDEIYARVCLRPLDQQPPGQPPCARSAPVSSLTGESLES